MRRKPDLVVPIRDRRQHRRFLTLKNLGYAFLATIVLFAGITIEANLRGRHYGEEFGRLYSKQLPATPEVKSRQPDIIREGQVSDQTHADPTLVDAAAREQILMADSNVPPPAAAAIAQP